MRAAVLSAGLALLLTTTGCTDAPPPTETTTPTGGAIGDMTTRTGPGDPPTPVDAPDGVVRVQGCEPRSLLPADVTRICGQQVVGALFSQLVELDPVDSDPSWGSDSDDAVADSISSLDARRWVVELEPGWEFHDGTPVTASSFVDAWNDAARGANGRAAAFLFEPILGFDDVHCAEQGCQPDDDELDGLRVIDELTLEITLRTADRHFPRRLGHVAYSPLPAAALDDPDAFAEAPVGNGPMRLEGGWVHEERISLRPFEDHPVPSAVGVDLLLLEDAEAAWRAMSEGRLDVITTVPSVLRPQARQQLDQVVRDGDVYEFLVVPSNRPALSEDPRLARALSQAIDRRAVIAAELGGRARPARGLVPPAVSSEADRCGQRCRFDPERARELLAEVGFPPGGLELWYDLDGGNREWVRAIAEQWRTHLGLGEQQVRLRSLRHTSWVSHVDDRRVRGLYPLGWSMDVASPREYLQELHGPGGLFNFDRYGGADVAQRLARAGRADTAASADLAYRALERDLLADWHHIPLWVRTQEAFHTNRVAGVSLDAQGRVLLTRLQVTDA